MGLETAAILIAVGAASKVGELSFASSAAAARQQGLDLQAKQLELQTQQKTLANYDSMTKVIDAQNAHMTTTGTSFSSPSFNAIQRETLNIGAKRQKNIDIEYELGEENIKIEKENVRNTLFAQMFGAASDIAFKGFEFDAKRPKNKTPQLET